MLENHHWRSAVSCIIESGILDQMRDIQTKLQSQISSLILATDITRQQEYLSQFKVSTRCSVSWDDANDLSSSYVFQQVSLLVWLQKYLSQVQLCIPTGLYELGRR